MTRPELESRAFWRELVPELAALSPLSVANPAPVTPDMIKSASASLNADGYLQLPPIFSDDQLAPLRSGLSKLETAGIPPVYIYVYEHPWALFAHLGPLIAHFLGEHYALLPNFWAWHLPLTPGASGWPRHRDCDAETRFPGADGWQSLMSLSFWLALTDATPENGCMSVLPRSWEANPAKSDGRALPAKAGSVLGWTQDLYHWSNPVQDTALLGRHPRRMSLSLEFQNRAFQPMAQPLLDLQAPPPFKQRLELVRQQFAKYHHMETLEVL